MESRGVEPTVCDVLRAYSESRYPFAYALNVCETPRGTMIKFFLRESLKTTKNKKGVDINSITVSAKKIFFFSTDNVHFKLPIVTQTELTRQ